MDYKEINEKLKDEIEVLKVIIDSQKEIISAQTTLIKHTHIPFKDKEYMTFCEALECLKRGHDIIHEDRPGFESIFPQEIFDRPDENMFTLNQVLSDKWKIYKEDEY